MNDRFSVCTTWDPQIADVNAMMKISVDSMFFLWLVQTVQIDVFRLSKETKDGLGNFNYTVCSCCKSFIPFFPASFSSEIECYQEEKNVNTICFGIGTENGEDCNQILQHSMTIDVL